ncbi:MAG: Uma2 family endonuclease [Deltaproteobacteria bacterium]|nr:Uma2 family endonuclease [Deltaproteobacteria bacterium]
MAPLAKKLCTYEDLLAYPEDARVELIHGSVVTAPAPLPRHSNAQRFLSREVGGPFHDDDGFGGPGGWWIFPEVDVRLNLHNVVRPDLAGWRRERLADPATLRPIDVVPDWICEILSPTSVSRDRVDKRALYAETGVAYYWLVDPEARTLEAHTLEGDTWLLSGSYDESASARIAPFEEVELAIGRLFLPRVEQPAEPESEAT